MLLEITDQRAKDALIDFIDELDASIYSDANILAMLYSLHVPETTGMPMLQHSSAFRP